MGAFDDLVAAPQTHGASRGAFSDLVAGGVPAYSGNEPSRIQAFGYGAADAASLGFGDEGAGVLAGVGAALSGGDYALAYRRRVDEARERLEEARRVHPISTGLGTAAGAIAPFLIPGAGEANAARLATEGATAGGRLLEAGRAVRGVLSGESLPYGRQLMEAAHGRGIGAALAQGVQGFRQGAIFGGLYGTGSQNHGDLLDRFANGGIEGGKQGAMWGGITPPVFQAIGFGRAGEPALNALGSAVVRAIGGGVGGGSLSYLTTGQIDPSWVGYGAGIGVAGRPILNRSVGPLLGAIQAAWRNPRVAFGNQTGMSIGIPPMSGGATAPAPPSIPNGVVRSIDRLIGRQRYNVDELERRIIDSEADPLGRTLADVGGEQFLAKADMLSQAPGETGPQAAAIAESRAGAMPSILDRDLREGLGVTSSPTQARDQLIKARQANSDGYQDVLARPINQAALREKLIPLMRLRRFQPVLQRRYDIESDLEEMAALNGDRAPGRSVVQRADGTYDLSDNASGQALHDLKTNVDDVFDAATDPRNLDAAGKGERYTVLDPLRRRFIDALDETIPGYRARRATAGGLYEAEEALAEGKKILSQRPEEIESRINAASPFARDHIRIAAADDLLGKIWKAATDADSSRMRNAANPIISPEMKNRIRALFGDATKADAFVRKVNELDRLFRNSARWTSGADTFRRAAQFGDQFMASLGEAGLEAAHNPVGAIGKTGRAALNALRTRATEREANELGNALLRNTEGVNPEDRAYLAALVRELRKLEAARTGRALGSAREGAQGGVFSSGSSDADNQGYY